jgi:UDP-glucose 4-epimerase
VVDDLSTGTLSNLEGLESQVEFIKGDIRDRILLVRAFSGARVVFHEAAMVSVPQSIEDPIKANDINVCGTLCVLSTAKEMGVKRVVLATSCAVYGDSPIFPKEESMPPNPISPYASTKHMTELYARMYNDLYQLETVSLRYFNVYGPGQSPNLEYAAVIPEFILAMLQGRRPVIFGDGTQSRDFVYVDDVVEANLAAASLPGIAGQTVNVGNGTEHSINDLVSMLNEIMGTGLPPVYRPRRERDPVRSVAATERSRHVLHFVPQVSLRQGLEHTVSWFRARLDDKAKTVSVVPTL